MRTTDCVFCRREALDAVLAETEHFYVLADHAPLVEGHTLIIPRDHHACFGAIPDAYEAELVAIRRRVADFLTATYRAPAFFEHGVFHQSVFHAHLHAMPFGSLDLPSDLFTADGARPAASLADIRDWYASHGHYFYLEMPASGGATTAAVFPPNETRYWQVLAALRHATSRHTEWHPQPIRRELGRPLMRSLQQKWQTFDSAHQ